MNLIKRNVKRRKEGRRMAWMVIAAVALIGVLALVAGVDTSDGDDWATHPRV